MNLLLATILLLGCYVYMLARPISYGWEYHTKTEYEGVAFEGTTVYERGNKMYTCNNSFPEPLEYFYFYKDGYVFSLIATTEEEYAEEVAFIEDNFEDAVSSPFYACKINAFSLTAEGLDDYTLIYTCSSAITFAIVGGVPVLSLIGLSCTSLVLCKKAKNKECA